MLAVGDPVPLLATPGRRAHEGGRPLPHGGVGHQLPAAEELDLVEVVRGALVRHVEAGEPVDLVTPQVDAHRFVAGRGEDVDDAATHGEFPPVLDQRFAPVPEADQLGHQVLDHDPVTPRDHDRTGGGAPGPQTLQDGLDRGHDDVRPPTRTGVRPGQLPEQPEASTHGVDLGAHAFEGQGLPCGEHLDRPPTVTPGFCEDLQVVGQL